ncbi:hypothetical protein ABIA35_009698 [Catenulispora sp. MAP12-49]|uniref:hypothetical protein n=1 Tax=Catenulispora sp. MAP12-49 TaxID=3156302 RepID=UPI0035127F01
MLRRFFAFASVSAATLTLVVAPAQAQAGGFHKYVALGDSYTAVGDLLKPADGPIGGNDIGFGDIVTTCGELSLDVFGNPCQQHFTSGGTDELAARIDALAPTIDTVIAGIRPPVSHHRPLRRRFASQC